MNKKLGLAVAGALLALSSTANAGITIPAGEWTIDIGGNVNAYYTNTRFSGNQEVQTKGAAGSKTANTVQTGLLPSALGIGGKTRQNDLDIAFQFTFFTGVDSGTQAGAGNNTLNIRQAYMTFGDASWGTIKAGRDLGIFASDAILSDMTLLGVGTAAGSGGSSTLGRIGSGYQYADWKGQITYVSPNWNGFDFAVGVTEGFKNAADSTNSNLGYEGKAAYSWTGDVAGKAWVGFISEKHEASTTVDAYTSRGWDVGAKASAGAFGLVGYYYDGKGLSGAHNALNGVISLGSTNKTDDNGGYVQATFTVPGVGTKLGASYGTSRSEDKGSNLQFENKSWIVGAYHPLTKSLNLVAEYTDQEISKERAAQSDAKLDAKTVSLGAILFF